jgi:uncharacterized protein (DUF1810 family)
MGGGGAAGDDEWDLDRFVLAQDEDGTYERALAEVRRGRKSTHWMWFVFPQLAGLGHSPTAVYYAISGLDEARAYFAHPVLGPRLRECVAAVLDNDDSVESIFGPIDAMKLRSSMTLFMRAEPDEPGFGAVLEAFFDGVADSATLERL